MQDTRRAAPFLLVAIGDCGQGAGWNLGYLQIEDCRRCDLVACAIFNPLEHPVGASALASDLGGRLICLCDVFAVVWQTR